MALEEEVGKHEERRQLRIKKILRTSLSITTCMAFGLSVSGCSSTPNKKNLIEKQMVEQTPDYKDNLEDVTSHFAAGCYYLTTNNYDKAESELEKALRIANPNLPQDLLAKIYNALGGVYQQKGLIDKAIEEYKTALETDPDFSTAYINLGRIYLDKGLLEEAEENLRAAIGKNPNEAVAYNNLGIVFCKKGRYEAAIEEYKKGLSIKPYLPFLHHNLGLAYKEKGMYEEAIKEFEISLRLDPNQSKTRKELEEVKKKISD